MGIRLTSVPTQAVSELEPEPVEKQVGVADNRGWGMLWRWMGIVKKQKSAQPKL